MQNKDKTYTLRRKFYIRRTADLLEEGLTPQEIASKLGTSKAEIRECISSIKEKQKLEKRSKPSWKAGR